MPRVKQRNPRRNRNDIRALVNITQKAVSGKGGQRFDNSSRQAKIE